MPVAIIYGAVSKSCRRIVVHSDMAAMVAMVGDGEGIIVLDENIDAKSPVQQRKLTNREVFYIADTGLPDLDFANRIIEEVTGVKPADSRCVVLDSDLMVVAELMADPLIDLHPDFPKGYVVRAPEAALGDELRDDGVFYRTMEDGAVEAVAEPPVIDVPSKAMG